jgi:uncharacterized membrane protein (DUF373 family)
LAFVGFSRTYYLKGLFGTPQIPLNLHIHGVIMTAWCALFIAQTCLVAAGRIDRHKQLGAVGIVLAAVIVALGTYVTISATAREVRAHVVGQFHVLLGFNLLNLLVFLGLFLAAVVYRRRPSMHKRLMLLATISLLPPAIARATLLFTQSQDAQMWAVDFVVASVVLIDVMRHRRLHPAFGWGSLAMLIALNVGYEAFQTDSWTGFVTRIFT